MAKWRDASKELPKKVEGWETYLVVCKTKGGYDGGYQTIELAEFYPDQPANKDWGLEKPATAHWNILGEMSMPFDVTHWMPLPRLPKEK